MFEPRRHGDFSRVDAAVNWEDENKVPLARYVAKQWRDKWLDLSLITYDRNQLQCNLLLIEALTWKTIQNKTFDEIEAAVRPFFPFKDQNSYSLASSRPHHKEAELRIAIFQQNEAELLKVLGIKDLVKNKLSEKSNDLLLKISGRFIKTDHALFDIFTDNIKVYILSIPALEALCNPVFSNAAIKQINKYFPSLAKTQSQAACVLAEMHIF